MLLEKAHVQQGRPNTAKKKKKKKKHNEINKFLKTGRLDDTEEWISEL